MRIKFGEVAVGEISRTHLQECVDNNFVTMGPKTKLLEKKWSSIFGYKHTVAVSSGTSACIAANIALYDFGAVPGDEVIVPALSFIATANAIRVAGFKPVFVDVKEDLMINETLIEKAITSKTKAIMVVTLMGKPPILTCICPYIDNHDLHNYQQ
jgi:dTDP-4-amino-4,6-dideoxygalactose transaminase